MKSKTDESVLNWKYSIKATKGYKNSKYYDAKSGK
jgi:hypothetical protein